MTQIKPNEDISSPDLPSVPQPEAPPPDLAPPTRHGGVRRLGDRVFSGSATTAGVVILVVLALVAAFLVVQGVPGITAPADDLPYGPFLSFVLPLAFATVWAAFLALLMAVPVALGIALFISHYAPRRLAAGLGYVVDLLAAVPSVVFGLWGVNVLAPAIQPAYDWLAEHAGLHPAVRRPGAREPGGRSSPWPSCSR